MNRTLHLAMIAALVAPVATARGQAPLAVFNPANGHTYVLTTYCPTPQAARASAASMGGYLVAINDQAESDFLATHFTGVRLWIGLSDELVEGQFGWDSGETMSFTNWRPGEPNNSGGIEDWVEMGADGPSRWNDLPSSGSAKTIYGLVEIPSALPTIPVETVTYSSNAHTYCRVAPGQDINEARAAAGKLGGHLVTISTAGENTFLGTHFSGKKHWIGLSDEVQEGIFVWDNNETPTYSNWLPGQPDNAGSGEDWVTWGAAPNDNAWTDVAGASSAVAAGIAELPYPRRPFQVNSPSAHLSLDGCLSQGTAGAHLSKALGESFSLRLDTNQPAGLRYFDLLMQSRALKPGGAITTTDGQIVNLDVLAPGWSWLGSGSQFGPTFLALGPGAYTQTFVVPALTAPFSSQAVFLDPTSPTGARLSQAGSLERTVMGSTTLTMTNDDTEVLLFSGAPLYASPFTFYGSSRTRMWVSSNGRLIFDQSNIGGTPTVSAAAARMFAGLWCDLNPSTTGTVSVTHVHGAVRTRWQNVRYQQSAGITVDIAVELDIPTGAVTLDGIGTLVSGGGNLFLGLSPGSSAQNPGTTNFTAGYNSTPSGLTSMMYAFGATGSVATGLNTITFFPGPMGYTYLGL